MFERRIDDEYDSWIKTEVIETHSEDFDHLVFKQTIDVEPLISNPDEEEKIN